MMDEIPKVKLIKKDTNQLVSMSYDRWIRKYVDNGFASDFEIIEYPDLVELIVYDSNGNEIKRKLEEFRHAYKLTKESPSLYDFERIDINELKKEHLSKNASEAKNIRIKRILTEMFYLMSFLLVFPIFSSKTRRLSKRFINNNINVIMLILTLVMIALMIIQLYISNNP